MTGDSPTRMRGKFTATYFRRNLGSPPRMRGRLQLFDFFLQTQWLTPAHAGKMSSNQVLSAMM